MYLSTRPCSCYHITEPPEISPFTFPENLREGNRAHVTCSVISGDLPIDIIWHKDGSALPPDQDVQEQQNQFLSSLLFSNLAARHAGHYTCIARNAAAEANFTAKLVIKGEFLFGLFDRRFWSGRMQSGGAKMPPHPQISFVLYLFVYCVKTNFVLENRLNIFIISRH